MSRANFDDIKIVSESDMPKTYSHELFEKYKSELPLMERHK